MADCFLHPLPSLTFSLDVSLSFSLHSLPPLHTLTTTTVPSITYPHHHHHHTPTTTTTHRVEEGDAAREIVELDRLNREQFNRIKQDITRTTNEIDSLITNLEKLGYLPTMHGKKSPRSCPASPSSKLQSKSNFGGGSSTRVMMWKEPDKCVPRPPFVLLSPVFLFVYLFLICYACCLLPVACCLLPVACCLLPVACLLPVVVVLSTAVAFRCVDSCLGTWFTIPHTFHHARTR